MRTSFALIAPLLFVSTALPAAANDSTYTDFDTKHCKSLLTAEEQEDGSAMLLCKGLKGYPVTFKEGDLRQSFSYGKISKAYTDNTFESFEPFNHTGNKIEWRIDKNGVPVATILRWFLENLNPETYVPTPARRGQVLVVSKVAQENDGKSCVAGYVDALANPDPNVIARRVADEIAPGFKCGVDEAAFHGTRGDKAAEPTHVFPE